MTLRDPPAPPSAVSTRGPSVFLHSRGPLMCLVQLGGRYGRRHREHLRLPVRVLLWPRSSCGSLEPLLMLPGRCGAALLLLLGLLLPLLRCPLFCFHVALGLGNLGQQLPLPRHFGPLQAVDIPACCELLLDLDNLAELLLQPQQFLHHL